MATKKQKRQILLASIAGFLLLVIILLIVLIIQVIKLNSIDTEPSSSAAGTAVTQVQPSGKEDNGRTSNKSSDESQVPAVTYTKTHPYAPKRGIRHLHTGNQSAENTQSSEDSGDSAPSGQESSVNNEDPSASKETSESSETGKVNGSSEGSQPAAALFSTKSLTMTEDDIHKGILQLVNKQTEYLFKDEWLMRMYDLDGYGYYLDEYSIEMAEPAAYHMNDFLNAFYDETGILNVYMMNGYRTPEDADWLFNRSAEENGMEHAMRYVMRAGFSEHHIGCSSDLGLIEGGPYFYAEEGSAYYWIYDHAADYGFVLRYPGHKEDITEIGEETWHFRYVSVPVANYMYANDLVLEEFLEEIRSYDAASPLKIKVTQGPEAGSYAVYYQPGLTISVPSDKDYVLSGNNVDGFLIVVDLN
ncbi:MAG: M15 family metallopeptidase [Lachnospiraceae bacterium]|nr:M15 family metallopeptidase [Lachnospiraceae bacterium]